MSNLGRSIAKEDIQEIFGGIGATKSITMKRNDKKKSSGPIAHIIYRRKRDAEESVRTFHMRELDGKKMHVQLIAGAAHSFSAKTNKGRVRNNNKEDVHFNVTLGKGRGEVAAPAAEAEGARRRKVQRAGLEEEGSNGK